ncbi:SET domain-containing protein-lysine N-methyltransferase [Paenibacillus piri]|uniref:SET domain-containing protein-lysine N-methyltransferase n=1 Tax=Paenibacillus piri TaxID=2547395 RepID=A0A4R5KJR7_9BACL|nr:SET domain-containing protein-lysine N-methyltransferase [Paenibacillus piri]
MVLFLIIPTIPMVVYTNNLEDMCVEFTALQDIPSGAEITVNYNRDLNDKSPLWYEVIE